MDNPAPQPHKEYPIRNFMVRISHHKKHEINQFYPDGDYEFLSGWLEQKHPFGYQVDYFTTYEDAQKAITICKENNPQKEGYWLLFLIYSLVDVTPRPDTPTQENKSTCYIHCPTCKQTITTYCNIPRYISQEQAATIRTQERNATLDALDRDFRGRAVVDAIAEIRRFPESLRSPPTQEAQQR